MYEKTYSLDNPTDAQLLDTGIESAICVGKQFKRESVGLDCDDYWYSTADYINIRPYVYTDGRMVLAICNAGNTISHVTIVIRYTKLAD